MTGPYTARRGRSCSPSAGRCTACETGKAKITKGYRLRAKYVLHTPGPVWHGGTHGEAEKLAGCYTSCLELASEYGCKTVDFPSISTGVYGYPVDKAAHVALCAIE